MHPRPSTGAPEARDHAEQGPPAASAATPTGASASEQTGPAAPGGPEPAAGASAPVEPDPATPRRSRARRRATAAAASLAALLAVALAAAAGLALVHRGEALPGTVVAGVDVGGRDPAEVADLLRPQARERSERPLVVTVPGGRPGAPDGAAAVDRVVPAEVGYAVDLDASVARALEAGREGPVWETAVEHLRSLWSGRRPGLVDAVDREAVRDRVAALAAEADREPDLGGVAVDPASLQVVLRPPSPGVTVRRDEAADVLARALTAPRGGPVALPADLTDPGTTAADVEAVGAVARAAVAAPVVLTSGAGQVLTLAPASYAGLLGSEPAGDGLRLTLDTAALTEVVRAAAAEQVDQPARSARLAAPARPPVVFDDQDDAVWAPVPAAVAVTEPSQPGRQVDVAAATAAAEDAIRSGSLAGPLPVAVTPPAVTTEAAQQVGSVIGTFTTYHAAGQPRVQNIHRIADEIDGVVVPAGEQFSIDRITGRRTLAEGYVAAPVIVDGELEDGVAGGISQFATTMFNAAFFAGLPLDQFRPHSYYISRYPMGREATLAYGVLDVRWTNDTGAPVLVDTSYTATSITVTLYGENGGRRVVADLVGTSPRANGGFTATVTRTVTGPVSSQRTITTRYNPPPSSS